MRVIAVDIVWISVICIASITIAIVLISNLREKIFSFFYCEIYARFFSQNKCKEEKIVEKIVLRGNGEKEILRNFIALLFSCWQESEKNQEEHYCFEVTFSTNFSFKISAKSIADELKEANNCKYLQMKSYDCGYRDDIIMKDEISEKSTVFIKYTKENKIEVIVK